MIIGRNIRPGDDVSQAGRREGDERMSKPEKTLAIALATGLALSAVAASAATTQPPVRPSSLERVRPEAPWSHDRDVCAACRVALHSGSFLNDQHVRLESRRLDNGVALRFTSEDAGVRDQLWKATLARGEMVEALRAGGDRVELCDQCRTRRDVLTDLQISAQRIPEGVVVVYTSTRPEVVRDLLHLLDEANPTVRF
jgi:hypothetical protein